MFAICVQIIFEKTSSSLVGWTIYLTIRKMLTNPDPFFVVVYDVNHTIVRINKYSWYSLWTEGIFWTSGRNDSSENNF